MPASANLETKNLKANPGSEVRARLTVRNTGTIVEQFEFSAVGAPAAWTTVEPPSISLFPGSEEQVTVILRPPRASSTAAGPTPFGIKVSPRTDESASVVEEGIVDVAPFVDPFAEVVPSVLHGSRHGKADVAIDQRGNVPLNVRLAGADDGGALGFELSPANRSIEPGKAGISTLTVKPHTAFWFGAPKSYPFKVVVEGDGGVTVTADATFVQGPRLPRWVRAAALLLVLGIAALIALWFLVLKPAIKSQAKAALRSQVASEVAAQVAGKAGGAAAPAGSASSGTGTGAGASTGGGTTPTTAPGASPKYGAVDGRLVLSAPGVTSYTVPDKTTLDVTDIILQNPRGDTGLVAIERNGTPLISLALDDFRGTDYHFVTPIVLTAGSKFQLQANCTSADCTPSLYYLGTTSAG